MKTLFCADAVFTADGGDHELQEQAAVLVSTDGRIEAVGPSKVLRKKNHKEVIVSGVLLPGLIDVHTHLCLSASLDPFADALAEHPARMTHRALNGLKAHLDAGVTTIRDVGGLHGIDLEMQHLVDEDKVEGPQVFASGKLISMTGGHACLLGAQVNSPDEARKAARQNLMDGARLLKVIATGGVLTHGVQPGAAQLTEAEMAAVCEEARKAGKIVAAHAQGAEGIENALRAGVHSIEHGFWLSDQAIAMMTAGGQVMVPTFAALRAMQRLGDQLPQSIQDKIEESHPAHLDSFQRAMRAGCTIACGTDAGTPANPHGNIADEIAAFRQSGMAIHDCWRSATREGAVACGLEDRGVLGAGKRADLCAVSREVFEMIPEVFKPHLVVRGGRIFRQ
ncbi:MAG: amidohydrolase family protein [Myxococcota bacterium]|nr:amidohydrolase family protein [Myxococcota bacterium]